MIETGWAARVLPGETECGDRHLVRPLAHGYLLAAVDGLGHGTEAARAAELVLEQLRHVVSASPIAWMRRCHERLQGSRGAVLSLAFFDPGEMTLTWLGVGNVQGVLWHSEEWSEPSQEYLLLRPGVVGMQLPRLQAAIVPVVPSDVLVFATDGLRDGFSRPQDWQAPAHVLAERLLSRHGRGTDDALVLVARCLESRNGHEPK